jgi:hypothetical protein
MILQDLLPFLEKLRQGNDLVMGNRFRGGIKPGAMPPLHRYLGNPVLTAIGRLFFAVTLETFIADCAALIGGRSRFDLRRLAWSSRARWW